MPKRGTGPRRTKKKDKLAKDLAEGAEKNADRDLELAKEGTGEDAAEKQDAAKPARVGPKMIKLRAPGNVCSISLPDVGEAVTIPKSRIIEVPAEPAEYSQALCRQGFEPVKK